MFLNRTYIRLMTKISLELLKWKFVLELVLVRFPGDTGSTGSCLARRVREK